MNLMEVGCEDGKLDETGPKSCLMTAFLLAVSNIWFW